MQWLLLTRQFLGAFCRSLVSRVFKLLLSYCVHVLLQKYKNENSYRPLELYCSLRVATGTYEVNGIRYRPQLKPPTDDKELETDEEINHPFGVPIPPSVFAVPIEDRREFNRCRREFNRRHGHRISGPFARDGDDDSDDDSDYDECIFHMEL